MSPADVAIQEFRDFVEAKRKELEHDDFVHFIDSVGEIAADLYNETQD
jgi:hypothetical protein